MANNIIDYVLGLQTKDPKRSNFKLDYNDVGTNSFGFIKVKLCKEIIAGSHVTHDFKSAYSTNPTVSPVLSRAKVSVAAIWIPLSLYVPAFRDGVSVKAGKTDYAFPTIEFNLENLRSDYQYVLENTRPLELTDIQAYNGDSLNYIPSNSIFSELGMYRPSYQPISTALAFNSGDNPTKRNAIPLLGYYDFFRHYVLNTQCPVFPVRTRGYSVRNSYDPATSRYVSQSPVDRYLTRDDLDNFFAKVRALGSSYPLSDTPYNISRYLCDLLCPDYRNYNDWAPRKTSYVHFTSGTTVDPWSLVAFNDDHYGEVRQTFMGDFFTSYLSNENVEYERSSAKVVADDGGVITMEQVYLAQCVQNYIRKTVFRNSDYSEFIDAQYGVKPPTNLTKPLFLGMVSTWLNFNDVVSQAQTSSDKDVESNTSLGSRASLGFGRMVTGKFRNDDDKKSFVSFTAREPGYYMVLEWITPEVSYFQGYQPMYDKCSLESLYYPGFDRIGYQDKQFRHLNEQVQNSEGFRALPPIISNYNIAYAQDLAWQEYMMSHNRMSGQMPDEGVYRHWVFHREVDPAHVDYDFQSLSFPQQTTWQDGFFNDMNDVYINPESFNHIFSNEQGLDNFHTYYSHDLNIYQPMSHRFLSY